MSAMRSGHSDRDRDNSVHERLYNQMHTRKETRQALEAKTIEDSMKECTFTPTLISEEKEGCRSSRTNSVPSRCDNVSLYERLQTNLRQRADQQKSENYDSAKEEVAVVSSTAALNFFNRSKIIGCNKENDY
jgi:hypothetical protein